MKPARLVWFLSAFGFAYSCRAPQQDSRDICAIQSSARENNGSRSAMNDQTSSPQAITRLTARASRFLAQSRHAVPVNENGARVATLDSTLRHLLGDSLAEVLLDITRRELPTARAAAFAYARLGLAADSLEVLLQDSKLLIRTRADVFDALASREAPFEPPAGSDRQPRVGTGRRQFTCALAARVVSADTNTDLAWALNGAVSRLLDEKTMGSSEADSLLNDRTVVDAIETLRRRRF